MPTLSLGQVLQQAIQAFNAGDDTRARRACEAIVAARPQTFEAHYLLGLVAQRGGEHRLAVSHLDAAIRLDASRADVHFNRGVALAEQGRDQEAIASYERAIALDPKDQSAHFNLGVAWMALKQFATAQAAFDRAIALAPGYARAHAARGMALWAQAQLTDALASLDHSVRLDPQAAACWSQRATVLLDLDRPEEALRSCERALALSPDLVDAHYNQGNAWRVLHRFSDAVESFTRALALAPSYRDAHINLADCLLMQGQFERGWAAYGWRWRPDAASVNDVAAQGQLWSGQRGELMGRQIVLQSELGLGDTLQFCRYTALLAEWGAYPILEVQASLVPLLQQVSGAQRVVARGQLAQCPDLYCPLMRLPQLLAVGLTTWLWNGPYLRAPQDRAAALSVQLAGTRRPRVGLVWRGSEALLNDKRSMALATLLPLLDRHPQVQWFSLQKDLHPDDREALSGRTDIVWMRDWCADWLGTAALVDAMDLVISVDTSMAHLAGAMGKPLWILLPHTPQDWRWFLDREDCPWYPTARLFRQKQARDWTELVERVAEALVPDVMAAAT